MQKQLNYYECKKSQPMQKNNIIFVLENLEHAENIGHAFRLADGFNIEKIILVQSEPVNIAKIKKTARNADKVVPYSVVSSAEEAINELKKLGYTPINIETTSTSVPLRDFNFASYKKIALVVGNERTGVSEQMLNIVPLSAHIQMYGVGSSLNVATALAIATYHVTEQLNG